ncbi:DUF3800 domain-containing protein [Yoonia sp. I 8.24]|uniref:DUF3800 domain-containing protein n=1 Tax=Yoonia sp. I 8.24 TaxID=1537229 RepID=UPI001EDF94AF|nr:DUF3800 domain-containing protein [Yoonia sp. I 8.24]MCG3268914.1 DUF3800 domain-containing protein [Yoonia sp. I 8.24]
MYIAFLDEAGHTSKKSFTVCGLTAIKATNAQKLAHDIEKLRRSTSAFADTDLLKFESNSAPKDCKREVHTKIKSDVIDTGVAVDATFMGYAYFNQASFTFDSDRNRLFGFNTLIAQFGKFLEEKSDYGVVIVDRLDLSKKSIIGLKSGFDYLKEKFQKGNEVGDKWRKHNRIISFSMTCDGCSHLSTLNDILTGSLMYLVNGTNPTARTALQDKLEKLMWKDAAGRYKNYGLKMSPTDRSKLDSSISAEYDLLQSFLNSKYGHT